MSIFSQITRFEMVIV